MLHSPIRHNSDRHNIEETGGRSSHASRPSVMVCLSPSPSTKRVIRTAARMAFPEPSSVTDGPPPIALYVGSTGREAEEDSLLRENIRYARKYGFEVHTIQGADIPLAIAEYARREEVTDLFLGYSPPSFTLLPRPAINEKLLSCLPTVDIHIVPDPVSSSYPKDMRQRRPGSPNWNLKDLLLVLAVMAVATFLSYWVYMSRFSNSNIITIYILAVLIASVMTSSRIYGTFAAVLYVLLFNFLFIEPRFTLLVYDSAYMMTYLVTVVAALITGTVAVRMKNIARVSAENAYQAKVLLDTSNQLEGAEDSEDIIRTTCMQLVHLLNRAVVFYPTTAFKNSAGDGSRNLVPGASAGNGSGDFSAQRAAENGSGDIPARGSSENGSGDIPTRGSSENGSGIPDSSGAESDPRDNPDSSADPGGPVFFPAGEKTLSPALLVKELGAVRWTFANSQTAGAFTSQFEDCTCRYLSVYSGETRYGVIGIDMEGHPLTEFQDTILLSIIHECTMALENERMAQEKQTAEIRAENERLRAALLRSISHDLRTPLTSIYGYACSLRSYEDDLPREDRDKIYEDIMEDADWLNAQFENILSMTRLESGIGIRRTIENMEDVIEQSLRHVSSHHNRPIVFDTEGSEDQIFFAEMEPKLIMQVMINLLNNAVKYTPADAEIRVHMERSGDQIIVDVADSGPGISDKDKPYIFDLFYSGKKSLTDSYRSMGIGLNLCAQIIQAHGGSIEILDNKPSGALFRFRLPAADLNSTRMQPADLDSMEVL